MASQYVLSTEVARKLLFGSEQSIANVLMIPQHALLQKQHKILEKNKPAVMIFLTTSWFPLILLSCLSSMSFRVAAAAKDPSKSLRLAAAGEDPSLLMVGNSLIDMNDLEGMVKAMLEEDIRLGYNDVYALRYRRGSAQWHEYAESKELRSTISERSWTWVILQEQSQISGFHETQYNDEFVNSMHAIGILNDWIRTSGAETILLMTWGRKTYDKWNKGLYSNFTFMQDNVAEGYYRYSKNVSTPDRPVKIAPAGLAYKKIHDSMLRKGKNPLKHGTDFSALYFGEDDDHEGHPSTAGSYLTACVIYATLTGNDVTRLRWMPDDVDKDLARRLQSVAASTVASFVQPTAAHYVPKEANDRTSKLWKMRMFIVMVAVATFIVWGGLSKLKRKKLKADDSSTNVDKAQGFELASLQGDDKEILDYNFARPGSS